MKKLICLFTILAFLGVANSMAQGLHFGLKPVCLVIKQMSAVCVISLRKRV